MALTCLFLYLKKNTKKLIKYILKSLEIMLMYILEIKVDSNDDMVLAYYKALADRESSDSGIDLISTDEVVIENFKTGTINFRVKCQMRKEGDSDNYYPYYLYPRSSISKTPLIMANSVGIIDKDYRGHIMAKVRNIPDDDSNECCVPAGSRLFQICAPDLSPLKVVIVEEITQTSRGEGGFGSTGKSASDLN